ncbi:peptidylprolyl isomerase [Clostridium sp. B9]|uniref:peptidylprolyl isomerase n=1 Tax=Clostridium sp. B9 TaxID=3423224 RepID=UPI003D2EA76F
MENKVLATVGNTEITSNYIDEIIARYPAQQQAMLSSEEGRRQVLEQAIAFELMSEFAKETGLDKTEEYTDQLNKFAKELLAQMVMKKTLDSVTVTDEEAKAFYEEHKENFVELETVTAKHILVASEEEAKNVEKEIAEGVMSFEEAASKYSTCPSKEQGGNLGAFSRGMMVPEFEEAAFNLELGVVSAPVQTQFGYHLIKVEDKTEATTKAFEEVKDQVVGMLIQERQQKKYLELVKELREKYGVKLA